MNLSRILPTAVLALLAVLLVRAFLSLNPEPGPLPDLVQENMELSGVLHPLTAVLLNFRGYDTLLEIGVLLVAVVAVWSLLPARNEAATTAESVHRNPVIRVAMGLLVPAMILMAGYMVWVGAYRPGGAFQAGAILGAMAVTLISTGMLAAPPTRRTGMRIGLAAGFAVFMAAAVVLAVFAGSLLQYPVSSAGLVILFIESTLSISIGAALAVLFGEVAGLRDHGRATSPEKDRP